MRRRDFIQIIAGSTVGLPIGVTAQESPKWRVGFLHPGLSAIAAVRIADFRTGLGLADVEIIARSANDQIDKLPALAAELVGQRVQAICAAGPPAIRATREATTSIPIVAIDLESDPVADGWAISLAHPGHNLTGIFLDLPSFGAKTLQLLREAVPGMTKVALLWHPAAGSLQLEAVRSAASVLNLEPEVFEIAGPSDFEGTFAAMVKSKATGLVLLSSPLTSDNPQILANLALRNRLPAISLFPDFAKHGGLIGYGVDLQSLVPQAGILTRKLLQGASVADLPIERPTRFQLVANVKTALALDLTLPTSILLSADEVIE